ncbi:hypothetical protein ANN_15926 [Periplaneta americana]|uniref:Major facilitator superfamily (MFS) profile domain-containing protein n=1 Tax=Periplaneta americana TaxID=6978 RepID=A0ABQ8SHK8_PERAM|nr:hypothetical protein ANN_15926 [Periplaneta americana]
MAGLCKGGNEPSASVFNIGIPFGNIIGGTLTDRVGRRMVIRITQPLYILGWILLATAQSYQVIIASRVILGVARGMVVDAVLVLLDEHSDAHLRGILSMHMGVFFVVGVLIITGIGTSLEWRATAGVAAVFPIVLFLFTWAVPESPMWLVRNGKTHIASRILVKAWGNHQKNQATRELGIMVSRYKKDNKFPLRTFLQPHVIKSFVTAFLLMKLQICTGVHIFMMYSVDIVSRARHGSQDLLDEYAVTNIAGFFRFAVMILMAWFSLRFKRRTIMLSSAIISGITLLLLAIVITANLKSRYLSERVESWILISLIFLYIAASTGGLLAMPVSLVGELVPSKIRGLASGIIYAVNEVVLGGLLKSYPLMWKTMGVQGMFWLFGCFCFLFALYVFLFVPETHNRTLLQVEEYFQGHNILWQNRPDRFRKENSRQQHLATAQYMPNNSANIKFPIIRNCKRKKREEKRREEKRREEKRREEKRREEKRREEKRREEKREERRRGEREKRREERREREKRREERREKRREEKRREEKRREEKRREEKRREEKRRLPTTMNPKESSDSRGRRLVKVAFEVLNNNPESEYAEEYVMASEEKGIPARSCYAKTLANRAIKETAKEPSDFSGDGCNDYIPLSLKTSDLDECDVPDIQSLQTSCPFSTSVHENDVLTDQPSRAGNCNNASTLNGNIPSAASQHSPAKRKQISDPSKWKRNAQRLKRLKGEEYLTSKEKKRYLRDQ